MVSRFLKIFKNCTTHDEPADREVVSRCWAVKTKNAQRLNTREDMSSKLYGWKTRFAHHQPNGKSENDQERGLAASA